MGLIETYSIDKSRLPVHVAVIMDGNGRWAKKQGIKRVMGHQYAVKAVRETTEAAAELGIPYLTLYAFSTENWQRPQEEVNALMELLVSTLKKELNTLQKNNIRLQTIGFTDKLPTKCQQELHFVLDATKNNSRMTLILALNYGARADLLHAVQQIIKNPPHDLNEQSFRAFLSTATIPDPDLLIRTSGEFRISNFLLWEIAYTELYFTQTLWPDFRKHDFCLAIQDYQKRERRFGKISEQL